MFGPLAGFVNGNMFCGLYGDVVNVRLSSGDLDAALRAGAVPFEPMGRAFKGYVVLPPDVVAAPEALTDWLARAYRYTAEDVPPKRPKEPRPRAPKAAKAR